MKFNLHSGTKAISLSLIFNPLVSTIYIIPISLN